MKTINPEQPIFYVYVYLDPRKPGNYNYGEYHFDYEPFYVGKGNDKRMFVHLKTCYQKRCNNKKFINKINKIRKTFDIKQYIIKYGDMLSESVAYELEGKMERAIGRDDLCLGPLCNLQDAGKGNNSGRLCTEETKKKMSLSSTGRVFSDDVKEKISNALKGNKNCLGKKHSEETKKKMSVSQSNSSFWRGKHIPIEIKKKMSDVKIGKLKSEETKKRMKIAQNRTEVKEKIRQSRWAKDGE